MAPDDAADLLGELPPEAAQRLLELMEPEEAAPVRSLLAYSDDTAGGLMTPEPVILPPNATVAEALARVRSAELSPALAAQVYVVRPPYETPTGRYLGTAHFQRMLREPPSSLISSVVDTDIDPLAPDVPLSEVTRHLASYDLVAVPWSTPSSGCSARSPSTTCSTTCCRTTGGTVARRRRPRRPAVAERAPRRVPLDTPVSVRRASIRPHYDQDAFGRLSERIARFLGTARFIVYMTAFVSVWLAWNTLAPEQVQFDPRGMNYTLLTLILSLQASYAAPLILLAQNRQADRDRVSQAEDRATSARLQADIEFLARELAGLRQTLGEVATRDFLRDQLRELTEEVVARTAPAGGAEDLDAERRREREERERRAERKKRRAEKKRTEERTDQRPDLGEPFVGEPDGD
jgi:uncharacterized membrane protein